MTDTLQPPRAETAPLLHRVAAREEAAISACIDRYGGLVLGLARRFLRDEREIEEAVQDVFHEIWQAAPRFDQNVASEKTFIAMIARRRLIDRRRRQRSTLPTESLVEPASVAGEGREQEHVEISEELGRAVEALRHLKPPQQRAIELAVLQGLSHTEVAEALGQPLGTIKSHIRRGLLRLRELLGSSFEGGLVR